MISSDKQPDTLVHFMRLRGLQIVGLRLGRAAPLCATNLVAVGEKLFDAAAKFDPAAFDLFFHPSFVNDLIEAADDVSPARHDDRPRFGRSHSNR